MAFARRIRERPLAARPPSIAFRAAAAAGLCAALEAVPARGAVHLAALADLSLEQLANVVVTTVARRPQTLADAAASVYVITADDIRRSGARTLAEALRLAPNLQVARADANQWAITARGFGNVLANKLLVLLDGRTLYSPLFSGVFWEAQQPMLEDVERIEVIDGPNGTLWGTNAVNGVINIVTRPASATKGALASAGGGDQGFGAAARYGAATQTGKAWRVYAHGIGIEPTERANGTSVEDRSRTAQAGFRTDWRAGGDAFTVSGDAYRGEIDQGATTRRIAGANLLGRWSRERADGGSLVVQAYYDRTEREHVGTFSESLDTLDVEAQATWNLPARNLLTAGAGYRLQSDRVENSDAQAFVPADQTLNTGYVFVQDEYTPWPGLALIAGIKVEYNDYTGAETMPNLRLRWNASPEHVVWAAASRAVRAPARIDRELRLPGVPPFALRENDSFDSEVADVYEIGLRGQPTPRVSYSLTAFHEDFERLRSQEPSPLGGLRFANGIEGRSNGIEGWGTWHVVDPWRLFAGGSRIWKDLSVRSGSVDIGGVAALGNDPKYAWQVRSLLDIGTAHELDVIVRHVGPRPLPAVPGYTAVDVRMGWRPMPNVEISLLVTNVTDPGHPEWGPAANRVEFERGWFAKLTWRL